MLIILAFVFSLPFGAQDDNSRQARELITNLHSDRIEERTQAEDKLVELGENVESVLKEALKTENREVAIRLQSALARIEDARLARTPEQSFRRLSESVAKAKTLTLRVRFQIESHCDDVPGVPPQKLQSEGKVFLREGNRASWSFPTVANPTTFVSDGSTVEMRSAYLKDRQLQKKDCPKDLSEKLTAAFIRVGAVASSAVVWDASVDYSVIHPQDFHAAKDADGRHTISYKLKHQNEQLRECKIWWDPKGLKILKREDLDRASNGWTRYTETYDEFVLNAELPDATFKVTSEK